jgi:hypothetical protein
MTSARDMVFRLREELAEMEQRLFTHAWPGRRPGHPPGLVSAHGRGQFPAFSSVL